jgi:hypothetical protein
MTLSQSELAILKKVNLSYSEIDSTITNLISNQNFHFKDIESIKIKKGEPTFIDKLKFWFFMFTENDSEFSNNPKKMRLDYRYSKSITIKLLNGKIIKENHTAFDLISTSKIVKKINEEINTPFKHRV